MYGPFLHMRYAERGGDVIILFPRSGDVIIRSCGNKGLGTRLGEVRLFSAVAFICTDVTDYDVLYLESEN